MRARLALAVSGTRHELREVKLSAKPDAMLAASPKGTVPVLVLPDGTVIDESLAIMRHALAQRDPEGWLDRDQPALIARNDGAFKHDLDRYKYPERSGSVAVEHRQRALDFVRELNERLADGGELGGRTRGLADAAIMPFIRQFVAVDAAWFETQRLARVETWLAGHLASDLFAAIMHRAPVWAPGNTPVLVGA
ncbi:glutathione S-transferase [Sphingomonas qomolangmaensis]|uniref:Glutathione S-transferase n=1 Tax=Sphingomonas qomolangmaensis TaxID=2918765 RepID=A0ABY5LCI1_9SPHN|nr:glutathione S-transferase [Sphingomonas qomolangmaensis]UUL83537.1 glutathione S-transferase [Sphingomonas qomolangmaensis]